MKDARSLQLFTNSAKNGTVKTAIVFKEMDQHLCHRVLKKAQHRALTSFESDTSLNYLTLILMITRLTIIHLCYSCSPSFLFPDGTGFRCVRLLQSQCVIARSLGGLSQKKRGQAKRGNSFIGQAPGQDFLPPRPLARVLFPLQQSRHKLNENQSIQRN